MGRRAGSPQTREAILEAAVAAFTEHGYAGTTIRAVAKAAEVDPALVMHFFGSKDGLFAEAIGASALPLRKILDTVEGRLDGVGARLTTRYLELWEDAETGAVLHAILSSAASSPAAREMITAFMTTELLQPVAKRLGVDHAENRAILAGSQLIGIAFTRYILRVGPMAELTREELVACVAPVLQRYLTGPLPL
ncbi:TetR family transcriptional regulator [Streptosporangiaceae bacterium NEAU-GS5]|nr:TetR family transcriptional regulator [Streptosporangiaceae bacterium NEAU-GS5]